MIIRAPFVISLILSALVAISGASAQGTRQKYKFHPVEANARLSNLNITGLLQDSKGFLWVGTDDGLNRFDGYDFKVYRNVEDNPHSLLKNKIQSIFEDSRGILWVSTLNSGLHTYDREQDEFRRIPEFSIDHCQVMRIIEDSHHHVWIGGVLHSQTFVASWDATTNVWTTYPLFASTDPVYSMLEESPNEFWFGTRLNGLFKWNKELNSLKRYRHDPSNPSSLPGDYIEKMVRDQDGYLWIATRSGLCKWDGRSNNFKTFAAQPDKKNSLLVNDIMDICLDGRYLWVATENGGLSRMDRSKEEFLNFLFDKNEPNSVINNSIWSLHRDRQQRLWVGSYAKGLCVIDNLEEKFPELDVPLENKLVNAVRKDSRGRLWIGTEGGIVMQDKAGVHSFTHRAGDPTSLSSNAVNCLFEDSRKNIWVGCWNGGINKFDEASGHFIQFLPNANRKGSLSNPNVLNIGESSVTHDLLVCTFGGLNIMKDPGKDFFENWVDGEHEGDQLLLAVYEDHQKNIWIGSYNGLSLFDLKTKKFKHVYLSHDTTDVSDRVNCIMEDHQKRLWVGSYAGLHQVAGSNHVVTYSVHDGLPVNIVQGILEDNHGTLWLGTTHGLAAFEPQSKKITVYDESDGLTSNEFRRNAFFKGSEGHLFVGGNGLNVFIPDSLHENPYRPSVFISDFKILNQSVKPGGKDGILHQAISETKEIEIGPQFPFFTIHYVAINFTASYKNRYSYKMEGFNTDWMDVGEQRFATFTNLDPGNYTFRVKASNNDGLWNDQGASLIIHVLPPWWKTLWFRVSAAFLLSGMLVGIYYLRINRIRRRATILEEMIKQRTWELEESNKVLAEREKEINRQNKELVRQQEELATQNEELSQGQEEASTQRDMLSEQNLKLEEASRTIEQKNREIILQNENLELEVEKRTKELLEHNHQLEQFAFISAHNLRAPVARILGLGQVLKLPQRPEEEKMILEKLLLTTQELDRVVKDLNLILDIRKNNSSVITEINLVREMEFVKINLQKEIDETETTILEDFSPVEVIFSVKPYIDSILLNLVSNAIKYRHPGRAPIIQISTQREGEFVCLTVRDNGLGIDLSKYEDKLFKLYSRFHSHVEGKGMGLYLVKTQVAALGGRIEVSGEVYNGITFKIYLQAKMDMVLS
jgi:ligand-binding sensor domain-containing protein/signal transduction histidine kinase